MKPSGNQPPRSGTDCQQRAERVKMSSRSARPFALRHRIHKIIVYEIQAIDRTAFVFIEHHFDRTDQLIQLWTIAQMRYLRLNVATDAFEKRRRFGTDQGDFNLHTLI